MKSNLLKLTALLLLLVMMLAACGPASVSNDNNQSSEEPTTEADTSNDIYIEREDKEVKNILMIGNSFCYYYVEELCGIAAADGYELTVANLYKSGAWTKEHYDSYVKDITIAELYVTNSETRKKIARFSLKETLEYAKKKLGGDWDVITLQQHFYPARSLDYNQGYEDTSLYAKRLFDIIREAHPDATLYWHETWAYQVGYAVADKYVEGFTVPGGEAISDVDTQTRSYENIKKISQKVAEENGVNMIPSADAWQIARADARVGDVMCARLGVNGDLGDYYHDGDIGGGQYLNACVWYEVLMGKSCVGNTWRPDYELSEEKIAAIQAAAHEAVAAVYGPGYAK